MTLPSCLRSSSSSCRDILEVDEEMEKFVLPLATAFAASSALSLAFCCKYWSVCTYTKKKRRDFVNIGQHVIKQKTSDHKMVMLLQTTGLHIPVSCLKVAYVKRSAILRSALM